jgi:hypothetical protein
MREYLKLYLTTGIMLAGGGALLMLANPPQSAEYVVSFCTGLVGLLMLAMAVVMIRIFRE